MQKSDFARINQHLKPRFTLLQNLDADSNVLFYGTKDFISDPEGLVEILEGAEFIDRTWTDAEPIRLGILPFLSFPGMPTESGTGELKHLG